VSVPSSFVREGSDEELISAPIRQIVFSQPGEGKTVYWGSAPKALIMVSDPEGTISAASLGHKFSTVQVTDYSELQEVYEWLKEDKPDFRWIIWDSLSLFQDRALHDDIMVDAVMDNPKHDRYVPSRREYLQSMNRIGDYVRRFCALPYNIGISCHVMEQPAPDGDGMMFVPAVQGKGMASKISGYMNVVGYLHKRTVDGKIVQTMLLQPDPRRRLYAKNRFAGSFGQYFDRPSAAQFDATIEEWRKVRREASSAAPAQPAPVRRRPTSARK
jgi:hypothetical protein